MPNISVILPVYNGSTYLRDAIESITTQSFRDFELIIINDGSTDDSESIIKGIGDSRVHFVSQHNQGLAATLNQGIRMVKGRYIARQDQDDLMLQTRLTKQVEYLESHPDCAMVGTWCEIWVGNKPTDRSHRHSASNEALQLDLLFDNPFVHSSVMVRTEVLRNLGGYSENESRQPPEDYELWSRIAKNYQVANIPEMLTVYREVEGSMSRTGVNPFLMNVIQISAENIATVLVPKFSFDECYLLASLYHGKRPENRENILTQTLALLMHKKAALTIGGDLSDWSEEFIARFNRQQAQIKSQFARRFLPSFLIKPAQFVKNFLTRITIFLGRSN